MRNPIGTVADYGAPVTEWLIHPMNQTSLPPHSAHQLEDGWRNA
jgi:hypothetical protein